MQDLLQPALEPLLTGMLLIRRRLLLHYIAAGWLNLEVDSDLSYVVKGLPPKKKKKVLARETTLLNARMTTFLKQSPSQSDLHLPKTTVEDPVDMSTTIAG